MDIKKLLLDAFKEEEKKIEETKTNIGDASFLSTDEFISRCDTYLKTVRKKVNDYKEGITKSNATLAARKEKETKYKEAKKLFDDELYYDAYYAFEKILGFSDSKSYYNECALKLDEIYDEATLLLNNKKYDEAKTLFLSIERYKDSKDKASKCDKKKEEDEKAKIIALKKAEEAKEKAKLLKLKKQKLLKRNLLFMIISAVILAALVVSGIFLFKNIGNLSFTTYIWLAWLWATFVSAWAAFTFPAITAIIYTEEDTKEVIGGMVLMVSIFAPFVFLAFFAAYMFQSYSILELLSSRIWLFFLWLLPLGAYLDFIAFVVMEVLELKIKNINYIMVATSTFLAVCEIVLTIFIFYAVIESLFTSFLWLFFLYLLLTSLFGGVVTATVIGFITNKLDIKRILLIVCPIVGLSLLISGASTFGIYFFTAFGSAIFSSYLWLFLIWLCICSLAVAIIITLFLVDKKRIRSELDETILSALEIFMIGAIVSGFATFSIFLFNVLITSLFTSNLWVFLIWLLILGAALAFLVSFIIQEFTDAGDSLFFDALKLFGVIIVLIGIVTFGIYVFASYPNGAFLTQGAFYFALWIFSSTIALTAVGTSIYSYFNNGGSLDIDDYKRPGFVLLQLLPLVGSAVFATMLFTNGFGFELTPGIGFGRAFGIWLPLTFVAIINVIVGIYNAIGDNKKWETISSLLAVGFVSAILITTYNIGPRLINVKVPYTIVTMRVTFKISNTFDINLTNHCNRNVTYFSCNFEFYNKNTNALIYSSLNKFDYGYAANTSTSVNVKFSNTTLSNTPLSDLKILYRINDMSLSRTSVTEFYVPYIEMPIDL